MELAARARRETPQFEKEQLVKPLKLKQGPPKMTFADKLSRLSNRMCDPQWRRYGTLLIAGKTLGIFLVFFLMIGLPHLISEAPKFFCGSVQAADDTKSADSKPADAKPAATPATGTSGATGRGRRTRRRAHARSRSGSQSH